MICVFVALFWRTHGTKTTMERGQAGRQCYTLANVLLGKLWSWHPCGYYFDTHHVPKYFSFMETTFADNCGLFQQDNMPQSKNGSEMVWGAQQQVWGVDMASKLPISKSGQAGRKVAWSVHLTTFKKLKLKLRDHSVSIELNHHDCRLPSFSVSTSWFS